MDDGESDPALEAVVEEELAAACEVITVVHQYWDVLSRRGQLQNLKPDDEVVLGVKVGGGGAGRGPKLAASHRLRDWDGGGQQTAGRGPGQTWPRLREGRSHGLGQRVVLVVAVHLKYHRLSLHVLYEGSGHRDGDVLNVVEVKRRSFPVVFQWFS